MGRFVSCADALRRACAARSRHRASPSRSVALKAALARRRRRGSRAAASGSPSSASRAASCAERVRRQDRYAWLAMRRPPLATPLRTSSWSRPWADLARAAFPSPSDAAALGLRRSPLRRSRPHDPPPQPGAAPARLWPTRHPPPWPSRDRRRVLAPSRPRTSPSRAVGDGPSRLSGVDVSLGMLAVVACILGGGAAARGLWLSAVLANTSAVLSDPALLLRTAEGATTSGRGRRGLPLARGSSRSPPGRPAPSARPRGLRRGRSAWAWDAVPAACA
jgi:hypothetical protein